MKSKIISVFLFIFLSVSCLLGQTVNYTYDNSGNRFTRITVQQLKAGVVQFPVINAKDIPVEEAKIIPSEGELGTIVYPNPTTGLIKIDILNMPLGSKTEATVYDLSGLQQMVKINFEGSSIMDISQLKNGLYILRIKINDKVFDWKVIKGQ